MELRVVSGCILVVMLVFVQAQDCPTGCSCPAGQATMICEGLDNLPTTFNPVINTFIFDQCNFPGELTALPTGYHGAHQLQIINSQVASIGLNALQDMGDLKMLGLRGNKLTFIDSSALFGLDNLLTVDLQANLITELPDELFKGNPKLEKVILNDNPLVTIQTRAFAQPKDPDSDPEKMSKIQHIAMENTGLTTVPGPVFCMHSKLPNLRILDLSRNNFATLEEFLFKHTDGLEELQMDGCELGAIGRETFGSLRKLKTLQISHNKIPAIDYQAFDDFFNTMETIHLENNNIKELPYGLFNFANIKMLNTSHNPVDCSCSNGWIQEFNINPNSTDYNVTCASPEEYVGQNALHVVKDVIETCEAPSTGADPMIAVYVAIPIILILSAIIIIIIVKICVLKKKDAANRNARYSLVYKPTTEKA